MAIRAALERLIAGGTKLLFGSDRENRTNLFAIDLEDGRITQRGTHEELVLQDGFYRRIYRLQTRLEEESEERNASL